MEQNSTHKISVIKNLYLYVVSFIALLMIVLPAADMLSILLKKTIFTKAGSYYGTDQTYQTSDLHRSLSRDIAYFLIGVPLFAYHFTLARKITSNK